MIVTAAIDGSNTSCAWFSCSQPNGEHYAVAVVTHTYPHHARQFTAKNFAACSSFCCIIRNSVAHN